MLVVWATVPSSTANGAGATQPAIVTAFGERGYPLQVGPVQLDPNKPLMTVDDIVRSLNDARTRAGLPAMTINFDLSTAAQRQASYMALAQRAIHTGPEGQGIAQRLDESGFRWTTAGEFVAGGFDDANQMVAAWLSSAGHRELVLGNYTSLGVGLAWDREGMAYVSGICANGY